MAECCKDHTNRVVIQKQSVTDSEYDLISQSLTSVGYINEQVRTVVSSIKWQQKLNNMLFKNNPVKHVLFTGNVEQCNELSKLLNNNGITSIVEDTKFLK